MGLQELASYWKVRQKKKNQKKAPKTKKEKAAGRSRQSMERFQQQQRHLRIHPLPALLWIAKYFGGMHSGRHMIPIASAQNLLVKLEWAARERANVLMLQEGEVGPYIRRGIWATCQCCQCIGQRVHDQSSSSSNFMEVSFNSQLRNRLQLQHSASAKLDTTAHGWALEMCSRTSPREIF